MGRNNQVLAEQIQNKYKNYELKPYAKSRGYTKQEPNPLLSKHRRLMRIVELGLILGFKKLADMINKVNIDLKEYPYYYNKRG